MSDLVRSELLKLRTTRGWWAYLITIVLLVGVAVAGSIGSAEQFDREAPDYLRELVEAVGFAGLISLIMGLIVVTTEFRHGTMTPTLLAAPVRERVLASKVVAAALVALLFGLLALVVAGAIAIPWLTALDADPALDGALARRTLATLLGVVLWALMGVAVGALVQSQVAALVGTLVWIFLGETLLLGLFSLLDVDGATKFLPFRALDSADGVGGDELLDFWPGVGVSVAWMVLIGALGAWRLGRRDIS